MFKSAVFLFLLVPISLFGQEITSISFKGLRNTKESYVRQFLTIEVGDLLDAAQVERDRKMLTNLEVLAHCDAKVLVNELGNYEVVFGCDEVHTLLPVFSFGGIRDNFWIQLGFSEVNLGGIGNKLTSYYQYYDRSSVAAHLTLERIKLSPWGANLNFVKWSTLEPLFFREERVEYEYDNWTFGATTIRNFKFRDRLEFGGSYFTEDYTKIGDRVPSAPIQVSKKKILGKLLYTIDRLNYHFFYRDGIKNDFNIQTVWSLENDPQFFIVFNNLHFYRRIGKRANLASRLKIGLSTNEDSPFAPFVIDSYLNIRGAGNRVDRGTGVIILNAEYRYVFTEKEKYAVQGVLFSDSGTWRNPGGNLGDFKNPSNAVLFAGGGVRFIHKKIFNAILRIDYGFNLQDLGVNGFVLGVGQYF